jgi:hypothetical protein
VEQGYYYTFNSVIALNIFFELGLSFVLVQCASHEWAYLQWTPTRLLIGPPAVKGRLAAMVRLALKWYALASLGVCVCILPAGDLFFQRAGHAAGNIVWRLPWAWLVIVSALNLYVNALLAVLEGCGKIAEIAATRAIQSVIANIALWLALIGGCGLAASPIYQTVMIAVPATWLYVRYRQFFVDLVGSHRTASSFSWRREVWPFQWRIALSWVSGYFIFQLFNPVLFAFRGPVEAGRMGMTVSAVGALQSVCYPWISTKAAPFGALVAAGNFKKLDRLFFKSLANSFVVLSLGASAAFGCLLILRWWRYPLAGRLLDPIPFGLLIIAALVNHIVFSEALYLRAHKQEPFLINSVLLGICTGLSTYLLGRTYGATGIAAGYCVLTLVIGLGGGTYIFNTKRHGWHTKPTSAEPMCSAALSGDKIARL